jgi:hypothetical protein
MLGWILDKYNEVVRTGLVWFRIGTVPSGLEFLSCRSTDVP